MHGTLMGVLILDRQIKCLHYFYAEKEKPCRSTDFKVDFFFRYRI